MTKSDNLFLLASVALPAITGAVTFTYNCPIRCQVKSLDIGVDSGFAESATVALLNSTGSTQFTATTSAANDVVVQSTSPATGFTPFITKDTKYQLAISSTGTYANILGLQVQAWAVKDPV